MKLAAQACIESLFSRRGHDHPGNDRLLLPSTCQALVKHYADPQIRNIRGQTPLDVARASWIGSHCKEKIARLLRSGAC